MSVGVVDRLWLDVAGHRVAVHVLELGLACCGIEVRAARRAVEAAGGVAVATHPGPADGAGSGDADSGTALTVLVVAGTVTAALAPDLAAAFAAVPEPRAVLAFGACAATGGPYWDSYAVLPGAHEVVPVDAWVAGCPPRPEDLVAGLAEVLRGRA
jgi:NADH-quinone oxidoreductase subunit B